MSALDQSVRDFLADVAAPAPTSTGGSVAAVTTAAAAGLAAMTAGVSTSLPDSASMVSRAEALRARAMDLAIADAASYEAVLAAQRRPRTDPGRSPALRSALAEAAQPPLAIARTASEVAALAARRRDLQRLTSGGLPDLEDEDVMHAAWQR